MKINIHADDYALTVNTSRDILDCMRKGALDSISIVPNMPCFEECMEMLCEAIPSLPFLPRMNIHLNLVEGKGFLKRLSWGKLFLYSFIKCSGYMEKAVKEELEWQIGRCDAAISKCIRIAEDNDIKHSRQGMRLDSHQHTHHLPIVWEALMSILEERGCRVEYIRCVREPLTVFLSKKELVLSYNPVNIIKNLILNALSFKIEKYIDSHGLRKMYLWGIVMSGKMDLRRIKSLMPSFIKRAEKDGRDIEILFHPGMALEDEIGSRIDKRAARNFYLSPNRHIEKKTVFLSNES